jgi:hypothetical protein
MRYLENAALAGAATGLRFDERSCSVDLRPSAGAAGGSYEARRRGSGRTRRHR